MIIRKATLEDFPVIDLFDVFARDRKEEIEKGEVLVAIIDEKVAGYMTHNRSFYSRPFVQFVNVNPEFLKQGVAKALFQYVEKIYTESGDELIFVSTEDDNEIMLHFFEKYGWERSGVIHNIQKQAEFVFIKRLRNIDRELEYHPNLYKA